MSVRTHETVEHCATTHTNAKIELFTDSEPPALRAIVQILYFSLECIDLQTCSSSIDVANVYLIFWIINVTMENPL